MLLWDAILSFVKKIINHHYANDNSIQSDVELSSFSKELYEEGFKGHDFEKITTVRSLIELVTATIFAATAGHSSITFSQFENYGMLLFSPLCSDDSFNR